MAAWPAARRGAARRLDALVRATVPELEAHVRDGLLAYGPYRFAYRSGRSGEGARVAIGASTRQVSLHVMALSGPDEHVVERFAGRLGPAARVGRTTVQFTRFEQLDLEQLRALLRAAAELPPPGLLGDG